MIADRAEYGVLRNGYIPSLGIHYPPRVSYQGREAVPGDLIGSGDGRSCLLQNLCVRIWGRSCWILIMFQEDPVIVFSLKSV
jgi:hypothetical protein